MVTRRSRLAATANLFPTLFWKRFTTKSPSPYYNVNKKIDISPCRGTDLQPLATPELPRPKNPIQTTSFPIATPLCNHPTVHDMQLLPSHGRTVACTPMAQPLRIPREGRGIEDECVVILLAWTSRRSMRG